MNKGELIDFMSEKAGLTKAEASRALEAFMEGVTKGLKKSDKVALVGFGTFNKKKRAARTARNPQTGDPVRFRARNAVSFKVGSKLKDAVN